MGGLLGSVSISNKISYHNIALSFEVRDLFLELSNPTKRYDNFIHSRVYTRTSWHGNAFRITGLLCGKSTSHWWIPTQSLVWMMWGFDIFFDVSPSKLLNKQSRGIEMVWHPFNVMYVSKNGSFWTQGEKCNKYNYCVLECHTDILKY